MGLPGNEMRVVLRLRERVQPGLSHGECYHVAQVPRSSSTKVGAKSDYPAPNMLRNLVRVSPPKVHNPSHGNFGASTTSNKPKSSCWSPQIPLKPSVSGY